MLSHLQSSKLFHFPIPYPAKKIPWCIIIASYFLSRIAYYLGGIRFNALPLVRYYQFLGMELLRGNLLQSLYYLHSQPPLFNLYLGIILKLFPTQYGHVYHLTFLLMGLALAIAFYELMDRLGVSMGINLLLTISFITSPAYVIFENWLYYPLPTTFLLVLSALALHSYLQSYRKSKGFIFFALLGLIVLLRSLFHIVWIIAFTMLMSLFDSKNARKIIMASLVPLLLVASWYFKNLVMFDTFSTSSWLGMNIAKNTTFQLPIPEVEEMIKQGELSPFALIKPFDAPELYLKILPDTPHTGIPALDMTVFSTGITNYNNLVIVEASKQYLTDAIKVIKSKPAFFLRRVFQSFYIYFHSSSDYWMVERNRSKIDRLEKAWNIIFYGQISNYENVAVRSSELNPYHVAWFLVLDFIISLIYGPVLIIKNLRDPAQTKFILLVMFFWLTIIYVTMVGSLTEVGENNRFRFLVDPFIISLMGLFLTNVWKRYKPNIKSMLPQRFFKR